VCPTEIDIQTHRVEDKGAGAKTTQVLYIALTRCSAKCDNRFTAQQCFGTRYGRNTRITAVDGRSMPSTAVNRDRTCANAGNGLKNLALLDVQTSSTVYARRRPPTLADTFIVTVDYKYHLNITQ